jgi:hypothetical protein
MRHAERQPGGGAGAGSQPGGDTVEIAISGSGDAELAVEIVAPGLSTLTVGSDSSELAVMAPATRPTGAAFLCL